MKASNWLHITMGTIFTLCFVFLANYSFAQVRSISSQNLEKKEFSSPATLEVCSLSNFDLSEEDDNFTDPCSFYSYPTANLLCYRSDGTTSRSVVSPYIDLNRSRSPPPSLI